MEGENIDRAALPPDRERNLDRDLPAGSAKEQHKGIDEPCVRLVEEPVERLRVPSQANVDGGAKRASDSPERTDRNGIDPATFDLRHERA